jgi:hypothetical protein
LIALVALIAAAPFADAFWDRDLGRLARELREHRDAAEAPLFDDLVRLCGCDSLAPLDSKDPLRQLVRIEAARRARLVKAGSAGGTIWRDVLRKDFFRRDPGNPSLANALVWPDEQEMWTGEVHYVEAPKWRCDKAAAAPASEGDKDLADALRAAGHREAASRVAYHRATRLLALNQRSAAEEQARAVDPTALTDLSQWAALLRIQLGIDGVEGAVALAHDWSGPGAVPVRAIAARHLAEQGRWSEIAELIPGGGESDPAVVEYLQLVRARALVETGRQTEAVAAIPRDSRNNVARDLAFQALAGRPLDSTGTELVRALWRDPDEAFARLAARALLQGSFDAARSAADAVQSSSLGARVVAAELAFAGGERSRLVESVAAFAPPRRSSASDRLARARAVIELANALAILAPTQPALRLHAADALDAVAQDFGGTVARDLAAASAALRTRQAASAGVVQIRAPLPLPDLPSIRIEWPEPRSLLAIPDGKGAVRDWFPADAQLAGGGPTP